MSAGPAALATIDSGALPGRRREPPGAATAESIGVYYASTM